HYGRIASRSGLSFKHGLEAYSGIIEPGHSDEIIVVLRNFSNVEYNVNSGDKIAQIILEKVGYPTFERTTELSATLRGDKCYKSYSEKIEIPSTR
ncbi:MAG: hypothetical protein MHPSP_004244, partial [Paramarteilia canceri]